ncbi:ATP-binding protein [Streptacidiphilus sp. ASG 303]|nr:ATP-binding protein [Streptacidiphilus sp. ASG 303]
MHPPVAGSRASARRALSTSAGPPRPVHGIPAPRSAGRQRRMVMALAARPGSVPLARSALVRLLTAWRADPGCDAAAGAAVVLSELVTNAVLHGTEGGGGTGGAGGADAASVTLSVSLGPVHGPDALSVLRLSVHDPGADRPRVRRAGSDEESGRGLLLVAALADRWGCDPLSGGGKQVWAELDLPAPQA